MDEIKAFLCSPYTYLGLFIAAAGGIWWWKMTATTANLTLFFAAACAGLFAFTSPLLAAQPFPARVLYSLLSLTGAGLFLYYTLWVHPPDDPPIPSERPFITIAPIKQDDYTNVIEGPDSITVEMMFEIKNSGTVETEAFLVSGETATSNPSTGQTQITAAQTPSQGVALAPGQKFGMKTVSIHKDQTPEQRTAFLSELRSATLVPESSKGVYTTELCIEYINPRTKQQRFRTRAVFKQTVNEAMIVSQSYDDLKQPSLTPNTGASPH